MFEHEQQMKSLADVLMMRVNAVQSQLSDGMYNEELESKYQTLTDEKTQLIKEYEDKLNEVNKEHDELKDEYEQLLETINDEQTEIDGKTKEYEQQIVAL